jgi:hypothetical protein
MTLAEDGASWSLPHCPTCNRERGFPTLLATRSNEIGENRDALCECMACGYMAVYREGTGQFEPPKGQPLEAWQPPLVWRTIAPVRPEAPNRPTASARPTLTLGPIHVNTAAAINSQLPPAPRHNRAR